MSPTSPLHVVQAQSEAYNAKDIEALLKAYASDAEQYVLHGELLARGHEEMHPGFLARFTEPDLHAHLLSRTGMANIVVDHEVITRNFPEGLGALEMLCIYEVQDDRIAKASFAVGEERLHSSSH